MSKKIPSKLFSKILLIDFRIATYLKLDCLKDIFERFCWYILKLYHKNFLLKIFFSTISCLSLFANSYLCKLVCILFFIVCSMYVSSRQCEVALLLIDPNSNDQKKSQIIVEQYFHYTTKLTSNKHFPNTIYANCNAKLETFFACGRWWS